MDTVLNIGNYGSKLEHGEHKLLFLFKNIPWHQYAQIL